MAWRPPSRAATISSAAAHRVACARLLHGDQTETNIPRPFAERRKSSIARMSVRFALPRLSQPSRRWLCIFDSSTWTCSQQCCRFLATKTTQEIQNHPKEGLVPLKFAVSRWPAIGCCHRECSAIRPLIVSLPLAVLEKQTATVDDKVKAGSYNRKICMYVRHFPHVCRISGSLRYQKRMRSSALGRAALWLLVRLGVLAEYGECHCCACSHGRILHDKTNCADYLALAGCTVRRFGPLASQLCSLTDACAGVAATRRSMQAHTCSQTLVRRGPTMVSWLHSAGICAPSRFAVSACSCPRPRESAGVKQRKRPQWKALCS